MRSRPLSYADAVRLLGGAESPVIGVLNRVSGAAAAVVTVGSAGTVDFFAVRGELVHWGNAAATSLRERLTGVPDAVLPADSPIGRLLRRSAFVQTAHEMRELVYALAPVLRHVGGDLHWFAGSDIRTSHLRVLLELLVVPPEGQSSTRRWALYQSAFVMAASSAYRHRILVQLAVETPRFAASELLNIFPFVRGFDTADDMKPLADVIASVATRPDLALAEELLRVLRASHSSSDLLRLIPVRDQLARAFARRGLPVQTCAELIDRSDPHAQV
jgi:hypothetical protein